MENCMVNAIKKKNINANLRKALRKENVCIFVDANLYFNIY